MGFLEINSLSKSFGGQQVLDDISLSVHQGGTLVLFGKSGAGKTVLLRSIAGVVEPDKGTVSIGGRDVTSTTPESRGIGMAFQNFALFPHMTAFDNISSSLTPTGMPPAEIKSKVRNVAELLKIDHVLSHMPKALSNGQKQRTALARALVSEPGILLLDDPLRNVDAKLRFEMRLELPRLLADRGATVVYVTQDYKEAMALGDRIMILEEGKVVQSGTPEDIYKSPQNTRIALQFGDPPINLIRAAEGGTNSEIHSHLAVKGAELQTGKPVVSAKEIHIGIRPECIGFSTSDGIPVSVEAVTPLNEKNIALVKSRSGQEILLSQPAQNAVPDGSSTFINFSAADAILFDPATGDRIVHPGSGS